MNNEPHHFTIPGGRPFKALSGERLAARRPPPSGVISLARQPK